MSTQFFSFSDDTPFSTEAVLVNASSSHYEEDWPSIPHTHAFTELFYVSEGSGEFLIENQHFSIKKDDLIIVNPHIQHTEISLSASPLSYYTVGVFYFHSLFQELDEKNDGYEEICKHTLAILISQLRRFAVSDFQLFPSFHPSKECALVKRYLDSHYSDDINLEQLASLSHLNKYYLSHEFTRYYGISPISYLTHRRIEVCKNLLENTDHEISDIAHLAGFSSQSYLAQSFRKYCGMTAGEYRRSKKNQTI